MLEAIKKLKKCNNLLDYYYFVRNFEADLYFEMKQYILDNFEKVPIDVWNNYSFSIDPVFTADRLYFGKKDKFEAGYTKHAKVLKDYARKKWERSVKIDSISFVLDKIDGDFSVVFNGGPWSFLWGDDVVDYYKTIKNCIDGRK